MKNNKHIPLRRCVVCKNSKDKKELIRIVKNKENHIDIDFEFNKEGRGTYICKDEKCLNKIINNNVLSKVLRMQIDEEFYDKLREIIKN